MIPSMVLARMEELYRLGEENLGASVPLERAVSGDSSSVASGKSGPAGSNGNAATAGQTMALAQERNKQIFPVIAWVGGFSRPGSQGSPDRWPGVKSLCAVCGIQGTSTFSSTRGTRPGGSGYPGRPRNCLCAKCLCAFSGPC